MIDFLINLNAHMEADPLFRAGIIFNAFMAIFWTYYGLKYFITGKWG